MDNLPQSDKVAFRIDEAVKASGLGRSFIYVEMKAGRLPAFKVGGRRLILRTDLVAYLERQKHDPANQ